MNKKWEEETEFIAKTSFIAWELAKTNEQKIEVGKHTCDSILELLAKQRTQLLARVREEVEELRINPQALWNKKSSESVKVKMREVNNNLDDVLKKLEIISKEVK